MDKRARIVEVIELSLVPKAVEEVGVERNIGCRGLPFALDLHGYVPNFQPQQFLALPGDFPPGSGLSLGL
jgi:hypothetical protein